MSIYAVVMLGAIAILHSFGFFLLNKIKFQPANQRLILLHLSAVEMTYCFALCICYTLLACLPSEKHGRIYQSYLWLNVSFNLLLRCLIMYVIIDRTLDIFLHMKYPVIFTRNRVIGMICALWLLAFLSGSATLLLEIFYIKNISKISFHASVTYVVIDTVLFLVSLSSFVYLFSKVRAILADINKNSLSQCESASLRTSLSKKLKIPVCIISTYLVFNFTGDILYLYQEQIKKKNPDHHQISILTDIVYVLWFFGLISDCVIYVFLQRNIRGYLQVLLSPYFKCLNRTVESDASVVYSNQETRVSIIDEDRPPIDR